jgi:hypothetical protein
MFHCLTLQEFASQFVAFEMLQDRQRLLIPFSLTDNSSKLKNNGASHTSTARILQTYLLPRKQYDIDNEDYDGLLKLYDAG